MKTIYWTYLLFLSFQDVRFFNCQTQEEHEEHEDFLNIIFVLFVFFVVKIRVFFVVKKLWHLFPTTAIEVGSARIESELCSNRVLRRLSALSLTGEAYSA